MKAPMGARNSRATRMCHTDAIRTTLDINDELMTTLRRRLPGQSKTAAVEHAISSFLRMDSVDRLKALAGRLEIDDVSLEFRSRDRTN